MKRGKTLTILAVVAALALGLFVTQVVNAQGGSKTTLCHYSLDEDCWVIITVSDNAVPAHLAHGDSTDVANCPDDCSVGEAE